jgi:hypothetical protein
VGKPEGKRPVEKLLYRYEDNFKMDLKRNRTGWYRLDSSDSGKGPVTGSCEHCNELSGSTECWAILE